MKGKTAAKTALLFALSLSPMWVMAESAITTLPLPQKQACADSESSVWCAGAQPLPPRQACGDSETSVWCAEVSDNRSIAEVRHPLARITDQRGASDYFYGSEINR